MAKVLVACEESQTVCKAFRELGYEAYSCDIQECSGGHPEWHIQGDAVVEAYSGKYDMMIAHPPCTYLSNAGARHLYKGGVLQQERYAKGLEAKEFFTKLLSAPIERICIENPTPSKVYNLPQGYQVVQPYQFGHDFSKRTLLWLKNLPHLSYTEVIKTSNSTRVAGNWFNKGGKDRQKNRSKFPLGIAKAMASQCGVLL